MRVLICGGHVTPALAVIDGLPQGTDILYVGRKHALEGDQALSLEYQAISKQNIPFANLTAGRLQRKLTRHTFPALLKLPYGFVNAFTLIKEFKPDVIVGFGGYLSVPLCITGSLLKIPIVIHEQTLTAGLANRQIAPFATKICISWQTSAKYFPKKKVLLTGNPSVEGIFTAMRKTARPARILPKLVIVGGSLGSHAINILVGQNLEKLLLDFEIVHQTGDAKKFSDFALLQQKKSSLPLALQARYHPTQFIDPHEIISVLQSADLVISRAGINTITALLLLNKPALIIPLPSSAKHDQHANAQFFKDHTLGEITEQKILTPEKFLTIIHAMIHTITRYTNTCDTSELLVHQQATKALINTIDYVTKTSTQTKNTASN